MNKEYKIYKIQFPNGKVYIGQSCNYHSRWREHLREAAIGNTTKVYRAMRKYKIDITAFSIIEENILTQEEADAKEIYYIKKYDSWHNGYNCNSGGGNIEHLKGEKHPLSILSDSELYELRQIRASKQYSMNEVYSFYKDRLSYSGFQKCWNYETRENIASELNTKDLVNYYRKDKKYCTGEKSAHSKLSNDEVIKIRDAYWCKGIKMKDIWKEYKHLYSLSGFRKVILGKTYVNVPMPQKSELCKKPIRLTTDIVLDIRNKYKEGYKIMQIIKNFYPKLSESVVSQIVHNKRHIINTCGGHPLSEEQGSRATIDTQQSFKK